MLHENSRFGEIHYAQSQTDNLEWVMFWFKT